MEARWRRLGQLDILLLATGIWFLAKFLRYAFPPLFEPLQASYDVSNADLGLAFTGLMLAYAAMQFPSGVLRDRLGPVRVIIAGAVIAALAAIGLLVETGFGVLVLAMLVIGAGTGLHKTVSVPMLARVYPGHTGRVLGVHETVGTSAGVLAPLAVVFFLERGGWRTLFFLAGLAGLVFAGLAALRMPRRLVASPAEPARASPSPSLGQYFGLFRQTRFGVFVVLTILFAFTFNGVIAFLPLYLVDVSGLNLGFANVLYGLLFAATVVQLVTGDLSDRVGRLPMIGVCLVGGLLGMTGLLFGSHTAIVVAAVAAFGLGMHGYRPVRDAYMTAIVPDTAVGGGIGLVRTFLMGAGAIAPATVGILADWLGFRIAFGTLTLSLVLAGGATLLLLAYPD